MLLALSISSASSWLWVSNFVYMGGAVLTLGAALHVRHEKRRVEAGDKSKVFFPSDRSIIAAALISLLGTAGAIYFGDTVSHFKDTDLAAYENQADVKIAQAKLKPLRPKLTLPQPNSNLKISSPVNSTSQGK